MQARTNKRNNIGLQAVRALAMLCIFLSHCQFPNIVTWAVTVFFVISGFVLTRSALSTPEDTAPTARNALSFAAKKLGSLYLLHIITMLPFLLTELIELRRYFSFAYAADILGKLSASLLLIQSWIPAQRYYNAFNGVAWYLSSMGFIYFIFPFVLRRLRGMSSKKAGLSIGLIIGLQFVLAFMHEPVGRFLAALPGFPEVSRSIAWFYYIFPPLRALDFIQGCLLALLFTGCSREMGRAKLWAMDLLCLLFFALGVYVYRADVPLLSVASFKNGIIFVPFALLFVLSFAFERSAAAKLFTNRATVFFGDISAAFFLIHQCFIHLCQFIPPIKALSFERELAVTAFISFVLSIICSWLWVRLTGKRKNNKI